MRTTLASLGGGFLLSVTLAGPAISAVQEVRPGKSISVEEPDGPYAVLRGVPDLVIAGGVDQDQWFDCLRTIKVTQEQREEITPLVRTYLDQRRAWVLVYGPLLKRTMERRRELVAADADIAGITAEIQSIRKRNPRLNKIRRAVWNRLDGNQRANLIDIMHAVRSANRNAEPNTQRFGKAGRAGKGDVAAPAVGVGGPAQSPLKPGATSPAAPAASAAKRPSGSGSKAPKSASPMTPPSDRGESPELPSPSKAAAPDVGSKKADPTTSEPVPWSFND